MKKKLILGMILLALTINQFSFVSFADETDDAGTKYCNICPSTSKDPGSIEL